MSPENVEFARRVFEAFNRGSLEGVLDDLSPEFEFHPIGRFVHTPQTYRGPEGFVDFWREFRAAWDEITFTIERTEDLDNRVLTLATFHGRGGESGVGVIVEAAWLHTIEDGLIVDLRSFATWEEALEAAGLRE